MVEPVIIVAEDDATMRTVLNQALTRAGYQVRLAHNRSALWAMVSNGDGDLVISDVNMPDGSVFEILPRIRKARPQLPVVVMSAQNTFMTAIRASEAGAYDYLPKPFDLSAMIALIRRALTEPKPANPHQSHDEQAENMPLVGRSVAMQDVYRVLARLMQTDLTLMITGESGTGKELVARALHEYGRRRRGAFVAINMAAIPKDLIESELFGHEKGAFTGATQRFAGRFEQANGGTLFLDEIGDMPMEAQTRLLRVLQQGEYMTVGGRVPIKTDVRIVAASNKDLLRQIHKGQFREDLYYRLNVVPLRMPPLRERSEDVADLVEHFFRQVEQQGLARKQIDREGFEVLRHYSWPGNVRELENLVRRLAALYPQDELNAHIIRHELQQFAGSDSAVPPLLQQENCTSLREATEVFLRHYFASFNGELPPPGLYERILQEVEYPLLAASLSATSGNQIKAAELLGLNRNTLRKKMRDHDLNIFKTG